MPGPLDLLLAPVRLGRLGLRALDDLNTLAERARREPDPVEEVRGRLDTLGTRLDELVAVLGTAVAEVRAAHATLADVDALAREALVLGAALRATAQRLDATGLQVVDGGQDLIAVSERLDRHTVELVDGGSDLVAVSQRLDEDLRVLRSALPRLLEGLDAVEQLEDSVETVAETVEPLQGAAERVGRVTQRLSRSS